MNGQHIRKISIWLVTALYLLACAAPFIAAPTASPTQMPVGTIIAQTAAAAQTQTAAILPTSTVTPTPTSTPSPTLIPTITPTPSPTLIPIEATSDIPTATPIVTLVMTQEGTASSSVDTNDENGGTSNEKEKSDYSLVIDKEWVCTVLEKSPPNDTIIGRGARFSAAWTLFNRGLKTWPNTGVDLVFKAGMRNEGRARYDLPSTVIPEGKITIGLTFIAPKVPGTYRSIWMLKVGRTYFCQMSINFIVQ